MKGFQMVTLFSYLCAIAEGSINPLIGYYLGDIIGIFGRIQLAANSEKTDATANDQLNTVFYIFIAISFSCFFIVTIEYAGIELSGQTLTYRLRGKFYQKL